VTKSELEQLVEQAQGQGVPLLLPVEFYQDHAELLAEVYANDSSLLDDSAPSLPELQIVGPAQNVQVRDGQWRYVPWAARLETKPEQGQ
jgi:hypothetical protein